MVQQDRTPDPAAHERPGRRRQLCVHHDDPFRPVIAAYCRQHGVLTNEYEQIAADVKANGAMVQDVEGGEIEGEGGAHLFRGRAWLASDWESLVGEIMARFQERLSGR